MKKVITLLFAPSTLSTALAAEPAGAQSNGCAAPEQLHEIERALVDESDNGIRYPERLPRATITAAN